MGKSATGNFFRFWLKSKTTDRSWLKLLTWVFIKNLWFSFDFRLRSPLRVPLRRSHSGHHDLTEATITLQPCSSHRDPEEDTATPQPHGDHHDPVEAVTIPWRSDLMEAVATPQRSPRPRWGRCDLTGLQRLPTPRDQR